MKSKIRVIVGLVLLALAGVAQAQVDIGMEFVTVGDPGNPPDVFAGGQGSVEYVYQIGKYEVTNAQYVVFLNHEDRYGSEAFPALIFNVGMRIERDLARPSGQIYRVIDGWEERPVGWVGPGGARRFVNWMHDGNSSSGAYDNPGWFDSSLRGEGARFWLPNHDEWHKAAYYQGPNSDPSSISMTDYSLYPMGGGGR
jgi:sulfatase modifying factor 1